MPSFAYTAKGEQIPHRELKLIWDKFLVSDDVAGIIQQFIGYKCRRGRSIGLTPVKRKRDY
jgi:hypothetical protein